MISTTDLFDVKPRERRESNR